MNTIDIVIKHFGWQGGTIHQAKDEFKQSPMSLKDKICSDLMEHMSDIEDIHHMKEFFTLRTINLS